MIVDLQILFLRKVRIVRKSELKLIIKECLLEILAEGLGTEVVAETVVRRRQPAQQHQQTRRAPPAQQQNYIHPARMIAESMRVGPAPSIQKPLSSIQQPIQNVPQISNMPGVDMSSILQDTAMTTLREQEIAESRRVAAVPSGADKIAMITAQHDPEELFGSEAFSKWANLAFDK